MEQTEIDILLVEDNLMEAKLTMMSLMGHPIINRLCHVEDGAEALDFIFARGRYEGRCNYRSPKLILLDLKMPKVTGLEVLRELKGNERTKAIPIAILTSSAEVRDVEAGYQLGVNSFIVKPMEFNSFSKAISDLVAYWTKLNFPPIHR